MRLLVSCPNRLFLLDTATRAIGVVADDAPEYYGVSWTPDGQELVTTHSCLDNATLWTLEDYIDSERGYLQIGQRRGVQGLSQPHQVLCAGDYILVTNTGRNCITVVRRDDLYYRHVWVDDIRWDRKARTEACGRHINSVFVKGDRLWALAHNHSRGSEILEFSWPDLELLAVRPTRAHHAHNVWATDDGRLLVCDSVGPSLAEADTGRVVWQPSIPNVMTRGLACTGDRVFVGMSRYVSRSGRATSDGGVWVLDRTTWKEIDFIPLPAAGNVHEVRIIDEPDECHHLTPLRAVPAVQQEPTERYRAIVAAPARPAERWTLHYATPVITGADLDLGGSGALALATFDGPTSADVTVSARLEATPEADHRHVGLVARYTGLGDTNMVSALVEVVAPSPYVSLWENAGGTWKQLARTRIRSLPALLRLEAVGRQLRLFVDDRKVLTATTRVLAAGWVGVRGTTGRCRSFAAEALLPGGQRQPLFPPANAHAA